MSKKLHNALGQLKKRGVETFPAKVVSVDKDKGTCVVDDGELEYTDVSLSATVEDGAKRFYLFPKIGSDVFVSPVQEDINRLYVEFWSEVEELDFKTDKAEFRMNDDGFLLKKDAETLAKLMKDLLQEIQKMKFTTYAGGPTLNLLNKAKFIVIENRFKNFLKEA